MTVSAEVLKAVVPSQNGESDEKKSGHGDSAVIDQYKKIIREQVQLMLFENKFCFINGYVYCILYKCV